MTIQKIIYANPVQDNYQTLGKNCVFRLDDSNYGNISMMFLIFTLSGTGQNYVVPTSPYLIKDVALESYGNPIAHVTTSYTLGRFDEQDYDLYNQIISGASLSGLTLTTAQTISLPLYLFCIDSQKLDTRKYKNLSIRLITKDNFEDMGFSSAISIDKVQLKIVYDAPSAYVPIELGPSYNVYRTIDTVTADALSNNTYTLRVNEKFDVSNIYFMLRKTTTASLKGSIKSIKVTFPNNEVGIYDSLTNYYLNKQNSANYSNTFALQISDRFKKPKDGYYTSNAQNCPLIFEITYDVSSIGDYKLYVAYEYYSTIKEGKDGILIEEFNGSVIA